MANMRVVNLILRIAELITSIVAFACVAQYDWYSSKVQYMLFTGITSMIICLVFGVLYIIKMDENPTVRLVELVVNILWEIFWLAAAIAISTEAGINSDFAASTAFAWITLVLWTVSTVLSFLGTRSKSGPSGGATPSGPQTNIV